MSTQSVKVCYGTETRCFQILKGELSYVQLVTQVLKFFKPSLNWRMTYCDEEGDTITLSSPDEFNVFLNEKRKGLPKLAIEAGPNKDYTEQQEEKSTDVKQPSSCADNLEKGKAKAMEEKKTDEITEKEIILQGTRFKFRGMKRDEIELVMAETLETEKQAIGVDKANSHIFTMGNTLYKLSLGGSVTKPVMVIFPRKNLLFVLERIGNLGYNWDMNYHNILCWYKED